MRLATLQAGSRGPLLDLRDSRGLVTFLADGDPLWGEFMSALRDAYASRGRHRGPGPVVHAADGSAQIGTSAFESLLNPVLATHALHRDEYAAVWFGAGPVTTWLSAAASLLQGPEATREIREMGRLSAPEGESRSPATGSLAGWTRHLTREARRDVERLAGARDGAEGLEARLRELREDAAVAQGNAEAGMMAWVRERQDAETRLLLYRDRERELRAQLMEIDEAGAEAACRSCGQPLGDRAAEVKDARREEWESVVQDGRWWRRRRDQLEDKPEDLKAMETRALSLGAEADDLSEELERRKIQAMELQAAAGRLDHLVELEARLSGKAAGGSGAAGAAGLPGIATADRIADARAEAMAATRERVRATVHAKVVSLTGGRLVGAFPGLFKDWTEGGRRGGEEVAILELAARITLAELAASAGLGLRSVVFPTGLDRLNREDLPRVLADLVRVARGTPMFLVKATPHVAAAAPECFDLLYRVEDLAEGRRIRRQRSGLGSIWLRG